MRSTGISRPRSPWSTSGTSAQPERWSDVSAAPRVSIVIPAYNEADAILPVLERIAEGVQLPHEVLVVVDAPDDSTAPVIARHSRDDERVRLLVNTFGRG